MSTLKITLKKSCAGRLEKHKRTALALGLRRIHQSVTVTETPQIVGMVNKISYMLDIEKI
ncbi:MAG: 50S ribosomal protein L30 [Deltaproteobacteria bacterium]|nr:50S ribosomal protein L30 [Deltaproteobacteria bacterium]